MTEQGTVTALSTSVVGTVETGAEQHAVNPVALVADRMQNHWLWFAVVGIVLGVTFATTAYFFAPVKYAAVGRLNVESTLDAIIDATPEMDRLENYSSFVGAQTVLLADPRVLAAVVSRALSGTVSTRAARSGEGQAERELEILQKHFQRLGASDSLELLMAGLDVSTEKNSSLVDVRFESPIAELPAAVANAVIDAYLDIHGPDAETDFTATRQEVSDLIVANRRRSDQYGDERMAMLKDAPYGSANLAGDIESLVARMRELEARRDAARESMDKILEQVGESGETPPPAVTQLTPTIVELDAIDPSLVLKRRELEAARVERTLLSRSYRPGHPSFVRSDRKVTGLEHALDAAREGALNIWREGEGRSRNLGELRKQEAAAVLMLTDTRESIDRTNLLMTRLAQLDLRIQETRAESTALGERLTGLDREAERIRRGRVSVTMQATQNTAPHSDKRVQLAVVGLFAGFGLSFGIFFLAGTVNPKAFRSSQLINDTRGLRWLGVIPDMSDKAGDRFARDLAENCLHRIRNKIESRRTPGDGYAIMVTSPFQGDGKTFFARSLAWSYAESGHRTIIVDCDFIGRAMSHQFGKLQSPGVAEVFCRGSLADEVLSVGDNLYLLPVGMDARISASNLRIGALQRLIRTLREQFEIVIVDSGPVIASVEAIPVAASCDGSVLTIRCGRSRVRLPEAIAELTNAGSEYLGLVLNYAEQDDCMKYGSISKMSLEVARALETGTSNTSAHPLLDTRVPFAPNGKQPGTT
ncbi:MAG: hypothetical protein DWI12_12445 [Planctomycetota bacterium]|nr:MAG: hypothetical protein DWI12_12445 [Planctomycetota bacterium]